MTGKSGKQTIIACVRDTAAMEPGRDDREELKAVATGDVDKLPLWSPVVMTGKSRAVPHNRSG